MTDKDEELEAAEVEDESGVALDMASGETLPEAAPEEIKVDHSKLYVWVTDTGNDRIQKFDGNGKFLMQFGRSGGTRAPYNEGEFKTPSAITVDSEGNIWVADTGCHRIQKFDPDGDFILEFGSEGWGQEKFYWPEGIIAEAMGTILVVDTNNHVIKRYDDEGEFLLGFGCAGNFDGFMKMPYGVALDKEGNIYVADRENQRIQIFNEDGQFLSKFGEYGFEPGRLNFPTGIAVRKDGSILVSEKSQNRLQLFDRDGNSLLTVGEAGNATGSSIVRWALPKTLMVLSLSWTP